MVKNKKQTEKQNIGKARQFKCGIADVGNKRINRRNFFLLIVI